jgi:hypothetical protein
VQEDAAVVVGNTQASDGTRVTVVGGHCMSRGAVGATSQRSVRLIGTVLRVNSGGNSYRSFLTHGNSCVKFEGLLLATNPDV